MQSKDASPTPIAQYFAGESIFITGGTGFMGKVLVDKVLRTCPDVEKIYLLIRPKKQTTVEERWEKMTKVPVIIQKKYIYILFYSEICNK